MNDKVMKISGSMQIVLSVIVLLFSLQSIFSSGASVNIMGLSFSSLFWIIDLLALGLLSNGITLVWK